MLPLAAALIGAICGPTSFAQDQSKQQQQQIKQDLKAQQQAAEETEKRQELLEEFQPLADRYAAAMLTRKYSDALVQGYVSSLGQSLVPPDTPATTTFSFRVVQDIYPNAAALPGGRTYLTTGMLAHVENEAQLAMVLGHEIDHVIEEHALESLRRQRSGQRRNKIVGAAGTLAEMAINSIIRSQYSKEQEKAADMIGTKLALARGIDPDEAARFWDKQHERFGKRSLNTKIGHSLFGSHPRDSVRAANVRALVAGDLKPTIDEKRAGDGLATGTPRFGSVTSGLMRDTGSLMAERSDRHDLAIGLLEKARKYRPNDPRLLWALGRTHRMVARSEEELAEADSLLAMAAEQDKRRIYQAIHRDLAYAMASQPENYEAASEHLRTYVVGHIAVHGTLPPNIDDVHDKMVLFGDNEWVPSAAEKMDPPQAMQVASGARYHPTVWDTPAELAAYDAALQASTQQIEFSFGGALSQDQEASAP